MRSVMPPGGRGGQLEVEDRAAGGRAAIADAAAERVDDAVADRQAEAGALADRLGREERLEQLGLVVGRNARAGVLDLEDDAVVLVARADGDAARAGGPT